MPLRSLPLATGVRNDPASVIASIALWFTGSIWVVGMLAYAFDVPIEIVLATFAIGLVGGIAEWLICGGSPC